MSSECSVKGDVLPAGPVLRWAPRTGHESNGTPAADPDPGCGLIRLPPARHAVPHLVRSARC